MLIPFMDVVKRSFQQAVGSGFVGMENYRMVVENEAFRLAAQGIRRDSWRSAFPCFWSCRLAQRF